MMTVIILAKQIGINPDNIATPVASSLGDLLTLIILSYFCTLLYDTSKVLFLEYYVTLISLYFIKDVGIIMADIKNMILKQLFKKIEPYIWIHGLIIFVFMSIVPLCLFCAFKNEFVKEALYNGWIPILMSMVISG